MKIRDNSDLPPRKLSQITYISIILPKSVRKLPGCLFQVVGR